MKKVCALLALSVFVAQVAQASPVRSIFASQAEGKGGQLASVILWPGYGTNLNLIPTGETVKKAWLDDPSRVAIDFDGCLGHSGGASNGGADGCGATVIHLRQITGVSFPGLVTSANSTTLLTLIAEGLQGRKLYQFKVVMGKGTPEYNTMTIQPDSQGTPYIDLGLRKATLEDVQRGLTIAESKKLISRRDGAWSKVQNFLAQVRNGESINTAAQVTGANMAIITKLAELGTAEQAVPMALPSIPKQPEIAPLPPVEQRAIETSIPIPVIAPKVEEPKPVSIAPLAKPLEIIAKAPEAAPVSAKALNKPLVSNNKTDIGYWLLERGLADAEAWSKGADSLDYQVFFDVLQRGKETGTPFSEALTMAQRLSRINDEKLASLTRTLTGRRMAQKKEPSAPLASRIPVVKSILAIPAPAAPQLIRATKSEHNAALAPQAAPGRKEIVSPITSKVVLVSTVNKAKPANTSLLQTPLPTPTIQSTASPKVSTDRPSEILARFQIPMKEGGVITADKLLDVQQRIWNWKKGAYRQKLGKFIATLITSQETDKERSLQTAVQESGLSLNDVQYLAKASQSNAPANQTAPAEPKQLASSSIQVPSTKTMLSPQSNQVPKFTLPVTSAPVIKPEPSAIKPVLNTTQIPSGVKQESVSVNSEKIVAAGSMGSTADTLLKLRIPLKDGGSIGAEQLLTVQERIWNWKGGSVRKQLGSFIAALTASVAQGNEKAIETAVNQSGLSLNEVQYLLSKTITQTVSSKE
jgi:hypothetical protein